MARSYNQVILLGNLTRDIELRQTPGGSSVASMSIALNRSYKDSSGNWQEMTDYIDLVAWGPLGERCSQYLGKGSKILINGRLQSRNWEDKETGKKRTKIEVVCNDVTFLDPIKKDEESSSTKQKPKYDRDDLPLTTKADDVIEDIGDEPINLDDIPF